MSRKQKTPSAKKNSRLKSAEVEAEDSTRGAEQTKAPNLFDSLEAAEGIAPGAKKKTAEKTKHARSKAADAALAKETQATETTQTGQAEKGPVETSADSKAPAREPEMDDIAATAQAETDSAITQEQYIPVGEEQPMTVGAHLAIARKNAGLDIEQVAEALRLRPSQIRAIENSQYDLLPGQTFVTGFIRSYANYLHLDAVDVVQMFRDEDAGKTRTPDLVFPEPAAEGRLPGFGLLVAVSLGAVAIFAGWNYYELRGSVKLEYVEAVPQDLAERIEPPAELSVSGTISVPAEPHASDSDALPSAKNIAETGAPVEAEEEKTVVADTEQELKDKAIKTTDQSVIDETDISINPRLPDSETAASEHETEATTASPTANIVTENTDAVVTDEDTRDGDMVVATAPMPDVPSAQPAIAEAPASAPEAKFTRSELLFEEKQPEALGIENTDARIVVRARQESWVSIYADDAPAILTRVLMPGDSFMVPNQTDLKLTTANAGGLEIRVDGKSLPPLGESGAIVSDFHLVADTLLQKAESSN